MLLQIERGHLENSPGYMATKKCPIGLALQEKFPNKQIMVGGYDITIDGISFEFGEPGREVASKIQKALQTLEPLTISILNLEG